MEKRTSELTLKTLHQMSDGLALDFQQQLEACVQDCKQRPSIEKARKVVLTLSVKPHPEDPDDVLIEPVTQRKTPTRVIEPVRARRMARRNQLQFDWFDDEALE